MAIEVIDQFRDATNQQLVNAGDSTNTAVRVNVVQTVGGTGVGTSTVVQGTASDLNATIVGTVTASQGGAWTVTTTQATSPWIIDGTTTTTPSGTGTETVQPLRTIDLVGTALLSSTANAANISCSDCSMVSFIITGTFSGSINVYGAIGGASGVVPLIGLSNNPMQVANPIVLSMTGAQIYAYNCAVAGYASLQIVPASVTSGTATVQWAATQAPGMILGIPQGYSVYSNLALGNTGIAIKTSTGYLSGYDVACANGTAAGTSFVKLYDKASAATSTDTPVMTIPLIAAASNMAQRAMTLSPPVFFSNGISIRATALAVATNTGAPGTTIANIFYT